MLEGTLNTHADEGKQVFSVRDFLAIGFRQRRLIINTFLGIVAISTVVAFLLPKKFEAQMKILVRHERAEQVVSPERETPVQWRTEVSEEELQSEAELIRSKDLLGKVVVACNLQSLNGVSLWSKAEENDEQKIGRAVVKLEKALTVQPIKLTNLISVSYKARDPQMAAKVLNSLASLYLEKHLAMHRAPGQYEFFYQQAEEYRKALKGAEEKLDFERAFTEYQHLAQSYPTERQALTAQLSAARLCLKKLNRPQDALALYQAAAASPIPHLDWEQHIQSGIKEAKSALSSANTAAGA